MDDLDIMTNEELALYASRAQTALEFATTPEDQDRLAGWLAAIERERDWRQRLLGTPKHHREPERSRVVTDIVSAALLAA